MGLEPTSGFQAATCFQDRLLIRPDDFRRVKSSGGWNRTNGLLVQSQASLPTATTPDRVSSRDMVFYHRVRGEGIEPSFPGSKPGGLPLTDPRVNQSALRELNPPGQLGRLVPSADRPRTRRSRELRVKSSEPEKTDVSRLCLALDSGLSALDSSRRKERESNPQGSSLGRFRSGCRRQSACPSVIRSSGRRNRTSIPCLTGRSITVIGHRIRSVRTVGFEPTISCARSTRDTRLPHALLVESAQRESNPHFCHGKAAGYRYIMGARKNGCRVVKELPRAPGGSRTHVSALRVRCLCRWTTSA